MAASDNDQEKLDFIFKNQKGEITTEADVTNLINGITEQLLKFKLELGKTAALIPYENYMLYQNLYNSVYAYMKFKNDEDYQAVVAALGKLRINLRKYLRELTIIE